LDKSIEIEPTNNSVEIEPTENSIEIELIKNSVEVLLVKVESIFEYVTPAQVVVERKEVG
jgi:hypothetical protein